MNFTLYCGDFYYVHQDRINYVLKNIYFMWFEREFVGKLDFRFKFSENEG